jgi:hypothetical protein
VTNTFCGSRAATEEDTMILVNSKDVVASHVRDIQALAAASGRPRQVRGVGQSPAVSPPRGAGRPGGIRRGLAAWAGARVLTRPQQMIKTVEEL